MKRKNWIELTCLVGVLGMIIIGADSAKAVAPSPPFEILEGSTKLTGKITNTEHSPDFQGFPEALAIVSLPIEMSYGDIQGKLGLNEFQGNTEYIGLIDSRKEKSDWKLSASLANTQEDILLDYKFEINVSKPLRMKNYSYTGEEDYPFIALPETLIEFPKSEENVAKQFTVPENVNLSTEDMYNFQTLLDVKFEEGNGSFGIGLPVSLGNIGWYDPTNNSEQLSISNSIIWTISTGI